LLAMGLTAWRELQIFIILNRTWGQCWSSPAPLLHHLQHARKTNSAKSVENSSTLLSSRGHDNAWNNETISLRSKAFSGALREPFESKFTLNNQDDD
jgi:hypothetical protein